MVALTVYVITFAFKFLAIFEGLEPRNTTEVRALIEKRDKPFPRALGDPRVGLGLLD